MTDSSIFNLQQLPHNTLDHLNSSLKASTHHANMGGGGDKLPGTYVSHPQAFTTSRPLVTQIPPILALSLRFYLLNS